MTKVNSRKVRGLVQNLIPFKSHGALYATSLPNHGYAVFSYGEHWPLFVWDGAVWYENSDKYSVTTSKHHGQAHPLMDTQKVDCVTIRAIVDKMWVRQ